VLLLSLELSLELIGGAAQALAAQPPAVQRPAPPAAPAQPPTPARLEPAVRIPSPLSLAVAERLLTERNQALSNSRYLVEAARAARQIAGFKPNPTLQLGAEQFPFASPLQGTVPRFFSTDSNAGAQPTYTVQFSKLVERGGKREFRFEQASENLESATYQVQDTLRQQLFQLRQAFANALVARENLRLAESIVQQYDQTEQLTIVKVRAGDMAPMEQYRVRAGRLQFAQAVIDAGTAYELSTRDLLNLLDASPADVLQEPIPASVSLSAVATAPTLFAPAAQARAPATPVLDVIGQFTDTPVAVSLPDLRALTLQRRPDVQLARHGLMAAEHNVELAHAQRARDVSVSLEYQRVGDDHSVGFITQVPLFLYNNQQAGIVQAEAQRRAAEATLRLAERQALTDVEKAYQSYASARAALTLYSTDNINQVQRLQDIAEFTFRQGSTSLFELLEVQRSTRQTLMAYNQSRAAYQVSLWQLEQAVGAPLASQP
jgi:cobalt-zinc-cadmium efflux system outer membrane protein